MNVSKPYTCCIKTILLRKFLLAKILTITVSKDWHSFNIIILRLKFSYISEVMKLSSCCYKQDDITVTNKGLDK